MGYYADGRTAVTVNALRARLVKRRWVAVVAGALIAAVGAGFVLVGRPLASIATAYTAKTLCSEVFVAGHRVDDVRTDLMIDDLGALRVLRLRVDTIARTTHARITPLFERHARFREGLGCTLGSGTRAQTGAPRGALASATSVGRSPTHDTIATLPPNVKQVLDAALEVAFAEPEPTRPRRTRAVVVMQHGRIVAERYAPGIDARTPLPGWSMAKSVLNALVGVAVKEGKLALDAPVRLEAWSTPGDPRGRITLSHLLRMSSGLEFGEGQSDPASDIVRMLFEIPDMGAFAASKKLEATAGTRWKYSTGTSMILSRVLREALGDEAYHAFPRRALFDPLGMTRAVLEVDGSGTFVASSYMYATAREWGRVGQLYLQDGVWNGERILPDGWVAYSRTPAPAAPPSLYGAHFWLGTPGEYRGPPADLPADVFQAVGHEGQFLTIIPSHGVVIVRLGRTRYPSSWAHDRFVAAILAAFKGTL